jgi:hypothetical protein
VSGFDYTATDTPDDVVRSVAAEISGGGLKPLSDHERLQRQLWRDEQAWQSEQRRAEREHQRAEAEAVARHEAALEQAEANRRARLERQERQREQDRERQLVGLHIRAKQQEVWQSNVENAARNAVAVRQQQALLADVERHFTPPAPPPEPEREIVYLSEDEGSPDLGTRDFDPKAWMKKPRAWFQ